MKFIHLAFLYLFLIAFLSNGVNSLLHDIHSFDIEKKILENADEDTTDDTLEKKDTPDKLFFLNDWETIKATASDLNTLKNQLIIFAILSRTADIYTPPPESVDC